MSDNAAADDPEAEAHFQPAPLPAEEAARLAALRSYDILDTAAETAFDDITTLAAHVCQAPIALISLVDSERQWFKSELGLGVAQTPRNVSFCAHAILQSELFLVPDTHADGRFAGNPLVTGPPSIRFYAGAPLKTSGGFTLGTLCVIDHRPRRLSKAQQQMLLALARQTVALLELRRALTVSKRLNAYRSRVMARLGHDLKQPLQVLTMMLDMWEAGINNSADQRRVTRTACAIQTLGHGLDTLAKASAETRFDEPCRPRPVRLSPLLHQLMATWQQHAERKGLRLRIRDSAASVVTDPEMLVTILSNLVGNAIKYTARGGVLVGCRCRGETIVVEVIDTGCGVPADALGVIFMPFRQIHPHQEGLGLGLSIVADLARRLDHRLGVSSVVGKGSRFSLELPRAEIAASAPDAEHAG